MRMTKMQRYADKASLLLKLKLHFNYLVRCEIQNGWNKLNFKFVMFSKLKGNII